MSPEERERQRIADYFDMKRLDYLDIPDGDVMTQEHKTVCDVLQDVANTIRFNETGQPRNIQPMSTPADCSCYGTRSDRFVDPQCPHHGTTTRKEQQ